MSCNNRESHVDNIAGKNSHFNFALFPGTAQNNTNVIRVEHTYVILWVKCFDTKLYSSP